MIQLNLIRAISVEFLRRKLNGITLVVELSLLITLFLAVWLTTLNVWWWLFVTVIILIIVAFGIFVLVTTAAVKTLQPKLSDRQTVAVNKFVDKVERVTEYAGTPKIIVMFRVLRDLIWPREDSFIKSVAKDGTSLHKDFIQLSKDFSA